MFVCCECCVLSGRGLCDELITRPEESYRLCCVVVCDLETSRMGGPYIYDISRLRVKLTQMEVNIKIKNQHDKQHKAASSGKFLPTFRDNLSVPSSEIKNQLRGGSLNTRVFKI